jgi:hypothetical protein
MRTNSGDHKRTSFSFIEVLPALSRELEMLLRDAGESRLAEQIPHLNYPRQMSLWRPILFMMLEVLNRDDVQNCLNSIMPLNQVKPSAAE